MGIKNKQRPVLEILGTKSAKGVKLKQATEDEKAEDYAYVNDDVSEEDEDEDNVDDDDEDTAEGDDEDEDEDVHDYTNEGNLVIQELDTNLDMDFLKLFASSISAATAVP